MMMKRTFLLIFSLVLWGLAFGQTNELVGTFSVTSYTGSDPTPTVTGTFNSTVGFLPQNVDTGDVLLVRQVFSGNHRRKLYEVTGISGNNPLVLTLNLIEGTTGGPFPAGTHGIFRRTAKGALLDVPNVSQEIESYIFNYNAQHFEDADLDTVITRNDSLFATLNDGTEFYVGPSIANGIQASFQVGDSVYVVSGPDTIFTGIAYANPEIDTIYLSGGNYYLVTTEGDTILIGAAAQVQFSNAAPVNPATYLIHVDTLGVDTVWFDNDSTWVRFNVGGSSIGAPMFTTNTATYTSFTPSGVPPIGATIINPYLGNTVRKTGVASYSNINGINGRNVPFGYTYNTVDTLSDWQAQVYSKAMIGVSLATAGIVDNPTDITSIPIGAVVSIIVNNNTPDSKDVVFDDRYINFDGTQLGTVFIESLEWRAFEFAAVFGSGYSVALQLMNSTGGGGGGTYVFQNQVNGIDLNESGGTVTVAPNITELTYAAVVGADSILIWDSSANAHRRTSIAEVVALASAGTVTVTDQANGLDITLTGSDITIAPDFGEVANAAVASNDSLLIKDVSAGGYRRVSAGSIAGLATPTVTGVFDQANGADLSMNGTLVQFDYDFDELTLSGGYSGLEKIIFKDLGSGTYKAASLSFLSGGYVDLTTNQTISAGVKKFAGGLQWGAGTMPTGVAFGSANQTVFGLKAGTTTYIPEANWQDYGGLIIENNKNSGSGVYTTRIIGTGEDATGGKSHSIEFYTRPAGASVNVSKMLQLQSSGALFGNASEFATGSAQGVINVPKQGIGWDGGQSNWRFASGQPGGFQLLENGNLNMEVPVGQQEWVPFSDIRMKYDTVRLAVTASQIRNFKAYSYKWNASDSTTIGVIAQQIEAEFPEIVHIIGGTVDTMGVNYSALAAIAYSACQALQAQLDSLTIGRGVDTLASAGDLTVPTDKSVYTVSGNTTINALEVNREPGAEVTLLFTGTPTLKHNTAGGGSTAVMIMSSGADFSASPDKSISFIYSGSRWIQK